MMEEESSSFSPTATALCLAFGFGSVPCAPYLLHPLKKGGIKASLGEGRFGGMETFALGAGGNGWVNHRRRRIPPLPALRNYLHAG